MRSSDPHTRFQARIDAATRALAVAVADYTDFLAAQDVAGGDQQQLGGPPRGQQDGRDEDEL